MDKDDARDLLLLAWVIAELTCAAAAVAGLAAGGWPGRAVSIAAAGLAGWAHQLRRSQLRRLR